ncbi:hypothetical protein AB0C33_22085 [Nonomuraea sp. NPDC048881]|uniref:hypothetical protein n=1 Tax=Nonomuraea sp. NPDC048881 TaxID=3155030 RepID=UPI0033E4E500
MVIDLAHCTNTAHGALGSEWRMRNDPCFLKLAYWPEDTEKQPVEGLVPGMYLPVSYIRLLLNDDCTRGARAESPARYLGYKQVERYLVNTQFIELVKHGLAGTVGTTPEQLHSLVQARIEAGQSVVVATKRSRESVSARQKRTRSRGSKAKRYIQQAYSQDPLFGPDLGE